MSRELAELRRLVKENPPTITGRYPDEVRVRAARFARRRRAQGATWKTIASEVGVSTTSLSHWEKALPESSPFVPVVVGPTGSSELPLPKAAIDNARLTLFSPTGYRVEGLSVAQLAELLGQLS